MLSSIQTELRNCIGNEKIHTFHSYPYKNESVDYYGRMRVNFDTI